MPNNNPSGRNQYSERDPRGNDRNAGERGAPSGNAKSSAPRGPGDDGDKGWRNTAGDRKRR